MRQKTFLHRTLATVALASFASSAMAALILYEGFDYSGGLSAQAGGSGDWTGSWVSNDAQVAFTSGLSFQNLIVEGSAIHRHPSHANNATLRRTFDTASFMADQSSLWFSVLFSRPSGATSDNNVRFFGADSTVWQGGYGARVLGNTVVAESWDSTLEGAARALRGVEVAFLPDEANLLVGRIDFSDAGDTVSIWVNPAIGEAISDPGIAHSIVSGITRSNTQYGNAVGLRFGNSGTGVFDEIRLGTSYQAVVPVPEPAAFAGVLGVLALSLTLIRRRFGQSR